MALAFHSYSEVGAGGVFKPRCIIDEPVEATPRQVAGEGGGIRGREGRREVRGRVRLKVYQT